MAKSLVETLLHDFWMLSLCLEDAIEGDRWDEVTGLLQRREETLRTLERLEPDPKWLPLLRRALEADDRCQSLLRRKQRALLNRIGTRGAPARLPRDLRATPATRLEI
jgi:hypothetical protein